MDIILTEHAKEKMAKYGISKEQIKKTIMQGAKIMQTEGLLASHGYIKVAYKKIGEKYIIKTVYIG